jgi:SNF2 family DNA or RNA helicase
MGLGKTIQAIATAEILAREFGAERALIVCPASLKSQWHQEIARFSSRSSLIIEGLTHQRKSLYEQNDAFFKIVNYDVIHRDLDPIREWEPDLVILDEAQRIKNWQTRAAKSVKQIESRYAIVLTGTPLENRLEELHSIVEFVDRHRLGPLFAFKAAHEVYEEDSSKVIGYRDLDRINKTLAPILIRRTKKKVLDQLPPRMDKNFFVPMTDQQWTMHQENRDIVARIVAKWRRWKFLTEADQLRLRIALQNMRMSCDSTYLIDHQTKHGHKVRELADLPGGVSPHIATDATTGRPELRITLPDQQTMQQWMGVVSSLLATFQR